MSARQALLGIQHSAGRVTVLQRERCSYNEPTIDHHARPRRVLAIAHPITGLDMCRTGAGAGNSDWANTQPHCIRGSHILTRREGEGSPTQRQTSAGGCRQHMTHPDGWPQQDPNTANPCVQGHEIHTTGCVRESFVCLHGFGVCCSSSGCCMRCLRRKLFLKRQCSRSTHAEAFRQWLLWLECRLGLPYALTLHH